METKNTEQRNYKQMLPTMVLMAFILGVFVGFVVLGIGKFLANAADSNSSDDSSQSNLVNINSENYYDAEYIDNLLGIIQEDYIKNLEDVDAEDFTYGVAKGLIEALGDQYTSFLSPEEAEEYYSSRTGDFEGIGISLEYDGNNTYVETVIAGNPAEKAGLLAGDIIMEVDGEDVSGMQPHLVAQRIRGDRGTVVKLSVLRIDGENAEALDFDITREKIDIDNIFWEKVDDNTARIGIIQFNDETVQKFNSSWDKIVNEVVEELPELENIVVDLRGNPGGLVEGVKYVAGEFLHDGDIILKEQAKGEIVAVFEDMREGKFENKNIVVLVNHGSASSAEILASAIRDNNRGTVVGEETTGKGVEQKLITLDDGSLLLLVFQEWVTAGGKVIDSETPIVPDVEVSDDRETEADEQLEKALEQF